MKKILYCKEKRIYLEDLGKEVRTQKSKFYYIDDTKDFSCNEGLIKKEDLNSSDIVTNIGKEFYSFPATFYDDFKHIKRGAQIITPKDIGIIITETGLNKDSVVVEGGSGSGALACYLAKIVKHVTSYEIKEENQNVLKENMLRLGITNITSKLNDITKKIDEKDVDTIILDLPQPWEALDTAFSALKVGGFIVAYCPTITQISKFAEAVSSNDKLFFVKVIELIERKWKVKGRAVRPVSEAIGHTAFLMFVRRVN